MTHKKHWLAFGVAGVVAVAGGLTAYVPVSQAETIMEIVPAAVSTGMHLRIGQCPCVRWQIQVQSVSGRYETEDVLISSQDLFEYVQTTSVDFQDVAKQVFKAGQVEVYSKEGHVGVGFNGVEIGRDPDQGFSGNGFKSLIRTGAYVLVNLIGTNGLIADANRLTLDTHVGYNWDQFVGALREDKTKIEKTRSLVDSAVALKFDTGPFRGGATGHVGIDTSRVDFSHMVLGADAYSRLRLKRFSDFELGLTGKISYVYDGLREDMGLKPHQVTTSLLMDLSWVERDHTN